MRWMQTSSRNFLRVSMICGWRSIRRASFFLSLLVGLWGFSSSADEVEEFDETNSILRIDDLTPETRVAVSNLAISLSASSSGDRAVATVDDNVAAILALLQSVIKSITSTTARLTTTPYANSAASGSTLGAYLGWGMYDGFPGLTASPSSIQTSAFLYEIQRALYGQSGVPSSSQAILPVLWRMESALTNNQSSVDMGWTNSVNAILAELNGSSLYGVSLSGWLEENLNLYPALESIYGYFSETVADRSEAAYSGPSLAVYDGVLSDVWEEDASEASSIDSALRVVDANVLSALLQLDQTAQGISYEVSAIANRGPQVVVISNLQELIRHIDQVTNYQATAADEYQAAQMDYETSDVESDGRAALSYQMDETQSTMDSTVSTNYDFGSGSVQNPYNPIGSMISSFGQNLDSKLPEFNETGDEIIVLFDAQSNTPMDAAGVVRVNLRESMGSYVNTCGNVMSWFWRIVNSVFTILLVLRCMREVAGAI